MRAKSSTTTIKEARLWGRRPQDIEIDNWHGYPAELIRQLRAALSGMTEAGDVYVRPDPKRTGFYDLELSGRVFFIHISPVTRKVLLIASWVREAGADPAGDLLRQAPCLQLDT